MPGMNAYLALNRGLNARESDDVAAELTAEKCAEFAKGWFNRDEDQPVKVVPVMVKDVVFEPCRGGVSIGDPQARRAIQSSAGKLWPAGRVRHRPLRRTTHAGALPPHPLAWPELRAQSLRSNRRAGTVADSPRRQTRRWY